MSPGLVAEAEEEIRGLEERLAAAKARLARQQSQSSQDGIPIAGLGAVAPTPHLHPLLLLSDTALPLGSFAFSSGLESFLAHRPKTTHTSATFLRFLTLSVASIASTTLPFVVAGLQSPDLLLDLDNDLDASIACVVTKRASVKQGSALLTVWDRSFRLHAEVAQGGSRRATAAREALESFSKQMKAQQSRSRVAEAVFDDFDFPLHAHLAPLFGVVCAASSIPLTHALYIYLFNHAKTLVSAGIRASVLGPYQAQGVLANASLRSRIWALVETEVGVDGMQRRRDTSDAGQSVPLLDLWSGRHEIVYSRIFNS